MARALLEDEAMAADAQRAPRRMGATGARGAMLVTLAVAAVALASLWDETREASASLTDLAEAQASLAAAAAAGGSAVPVVARALSARGGVGLYRAAGEASFHRADGETVDAPFLLRAADARRPWVRLERPEAWAVGLPRRMGFAGLAETPAHGVLVVASSARRERDRQSRARWRLVLGAALTCGVMVVLGRAALRVQRDELELREALALAELPRTREDQLAREARAAMMVTFAVGVAHEVATPLNVIAGRAEQLEPRSADDRDRRALQAIATQVDRVRDVLRGFLRLARGDTPALGSVGPADVVHAARTLVEHRFTEAGVGLVVEAPDGLAPLRADARLLEQAFVNLLLNACDASPAGAEVRAGTSEDEASVTFWVEDEGAGIGPDDAARVLEPFFTTKGPDRGTGLGLAVTKEIVAIHRGTLALAPRTPHGTRASFTLPRETERA